MSDCALVEVQRAAERLNWTKSGVLPRRLPVGTALGARYFTCFFLSRHPPSPSPCPRLKLGAVARLPRPSNNLWRTSVNRARRSRNALGSIAPPTLSRTSAALARGLQDVVLVGVRVLFSYLLCSALAVSLSPVAILPLDLGDRLPIAWSNRLRAAPSPTTAAALAATARSRSGPRSAPFRLLSRNKRLWSPRSSFLQPPSGLDAPFGREHIVRSCLAFLPCQVPFSQRHKTPCVRSSVVNAPMLFYCSFLAPNTLLVEACMFPPSVPLPFERRPRWAIGNLICTLFLLRAGESSMIACSLNEVDAVSVVV